MSRRIVVCLACVALLGVTLLSLHALGPVLSVAEGQVGGGGDGPDVPIWPQAGLPRPWEAGLQASPFSVVNLFNGNLITIIPLVAFDPVGPPVELTLYHNSASADLPEQSPSPWGFSLGAGWSISYGGSVVGDPNDTEVTLIEDDGSEYLFTLEQGVWEPEAGVHDRLEWDDPNDQWVLTRPNQSKRIFDHEYDAQAEVHLGRLIEVHDSSGNYVEVARDSEENNFRILRIESAAEANPKVNSHRVTFVYDGNRLDYVEDPIGRKWTFHYYIDAPHPLEWVKYPSGGTVDPTYTVFQYDARDRIQYLTNRDEVTWDYAHDGYGKLASVTDPAAAEGQPRYAQQFSFSMRKTGVPALWRTTYTPRRGEDYEWHFGFDDDGNFRESKDPLNYVRQYAYDSDHNCTSFTDELSHTWTATYGPVANLQTLTSPIPQTWTVTWEQPYPTERPNFYRVTQVTDPLEGSHWLKFGYGDPNDPNDPNDPTLVTEFIEPPVLGGAQAVTMLEYYDESASNANGQLRLVTDANGVQHLYEYDRWGYSEKLTEGLIPGAGCAGTVYPVVIGPTTNNPAGWPTHTDYKPAGCSSGITYDVNGNPTGTECWVCMMAGEGTWPRRLGNPPSPHWDFLRQFLQSAQYDDSGRPTELELETPRWTDTGAVASERDYLLEYDNLGRPKNFTFRTNEHAGDGSKDVTRTFTYWDPNDPNGPQYDEDGRVVRFQGPDGQHTEYRWLDNAQEKLGYDKLGRPEKITRGSMSVTYTYDAAGRVTRVDYGNGTKIIRQYDNANRLEHIYHYGTGLVLLYQIDYVWRLDNTLDTRTEKDWTGQSVQIATIEFEYDTRHRLTRETRTLAGEPPQTVYDIQYDYDQLGNRTVKIENTADRITYYEYDTDYDDPNDPNYPLYPTRNNRLLKYEVFEDEVRTRRVWYVYYDTGHVSNIIVKDEGEGDDYDWYRGLSFTYWGLGHSQVGLALWEKWPEEYGPFPGELTPEQGYDKLALREFRYHPNPRGRFMTRDLDPDDQAWEWSTVAAEHWTDYDIPMPYGDFDVTLDPNDAPVETEQMRYLEGFGLPAQQTASTGATQYLHGDLIRSTMLTTGQGGTAVSAVSYTAFGEVIGTPPATRYQYAGGWGYETGGFGDDPGLLVLEGAPGTAPIILQHVGHRWYDPSTGRFIQRDPIGIQGGLNVYLYAEANPLTRVDPEGLADDDGWWEGLKRWIREVFKKSPSVAKKAAQGATGAPGPKVGLGKVGPFVQGAKAAPDIARIHVACVARQRFIEDMTGNTEDNAKALEDWKRNQGRYVKPRKSLED